MDNSVYTRMRASNHYIREHFNLLPLTNSESDENTDYTYDPLQSKNILQIILIHCFIFIRLFNI